MERNCILPDDPVVEILLRLPANDLLRFRSVCKGWCALIDDAEFIKKHHEVQYSVCKLDDNMAYFVEKELDPYLMIHEIHLLSIQQEDVFTVNLAEDLKRDSKGFLPYGIDQFCIGCCGCVNGIICLTFMCRKMPLIENGCMALWNPAIRQFKTLAFPNEQGLINQNFFEVTGFGFDLSSRDFKILGGYAVLEGGEISNYHLIYSLKSNSWKRISNPPANISGLPLVESDGYLNGVYYWLIDFRVGCPLRFVIVSFNFTSEVFKVSNLPEDALSLVSDIYPCEMAIALYKESLALLISHKEEESLYSIHIWVATQFDNCGVPLTWQPLFTVGPTVAKLGLFVDTILVNGNLQLSFAVPNSNGEDWGESEVYLYNHSKGEFKKFDFKWVTWFRYAESLFPLSKRLVQS